MALVESFRVGAEASEPSSPPNVAPRRHAVDVLVGLPLCIVALPFVVGLALVLAVEHRGNPFFVHTRIGRGGRALSVPKLRTLPRDHDPYADKTVTPVRATSRFTAFLRRTHLDELPQLFLVPTGRMRLVGPRPRMAVEMQACRDDDFARLRTQVAPGCTGLWQISVAARTQRVSDHPEYDRRYLEIATARLDLWILWRTALQILGARQISLDDVPGWATQQPRTATTAPRA